MPCPASYQNQQPFSKKWELNQSSSAFGFLPTENTNLEIEHEQFTRRTVDELSKAGLEQRHWFFKDEILYTAPQMQTPTLSFKASHNVKIPPLYTPPQKNRKE